MVDELRQLGGRLRAARQAQGLTLQDLADGAGMSVSTLSRLESGKRQASLELLIPVTRRLGLRIDDLLRPQTADPRVRRAVIRREGMIIAPLTPENSPVATYRITYPVHPETPALKVHDGYEWLYVLSGRLRLLLGEQDLVLGQGEAAEFDTRTPHAMSAAGDEPAQVISIFNETGARMHTHTAD
ncbi:XRE family transcriptional regulator [Leifsonia sp. F6_8S_P_1B]|uniref:XRE family transcriptional regulator n=1 Tax=Leifsonia williamsii TaxID=3035919 RepID=A0ABT8K622_9MICO|nr:XRE family transcriptional regulator [Leifsonia williamsii]MDN4612925.1 XRE family transcriptional regulator [Leifsonia williamsii]